MIGNDTDIKKPIKLRNTLYIALTKFVDFEKYYKIKKEEDGKVIITELKEVI